MRLRVAVRVVLAAGVASLAGCGTYHTHPTAAGLGSGGAVQAYNVTRVPEQEARATLAYPTGDRRTSCLLVEQVSPGEVRVGREVVYQIKVTNLTGQPVRGIVLRSRPSDGMKIVGSSATTRPIGDGQLVYDVGDLGPHEGMTIDVRALPDRLGRVEAQYVVSIRPPVMQAALNVVQPILKVSASGPADVDLCQEIVQRYTVTNAGTGTARGVTLQAALPDGISTADGKAVLSATLGDIPEGQSRDVTAHLKATRTGRYTTQAIVRSRDDGVRAEPVVTAAHAPNLAVAVRGPAQEYAGKAVVYEVTVTNNGDAPARQTTLHLGTTDIGQVVETRVDGDGGGPGEPELASAGVDVTNASLGVLAPGQSKRIEVTAQAADGGTLGLEATASAPCAQEVRQAARTRILTVPALAVHVADEVDPVPVGQDVTYTVSVTNNGTGSDTNVRVTAALPAGATFVRATGVTEGRSDGTNVVFAPVPRLAPRETATWRVTVRLMRAGDAQVAVSAVSDALNNPARGVETTHAY